MKTHIAATFRKKESQTPPTYSAPTVINKNHPSVQGMQSALFGCRLLCWKV